MSITTEQVRHVLQTFIDEYVVDVPAEHLGSHYMIPLGNLEDFARDIPATTLSDIAFEANLREVANG